MPIALKVVDTVKPVLTGPATLTVNPGVLGTLFSLGLFSVSDASMINAPANVTPVTVTQSVAAAQSLAGNSTTLVRLTATDPSGNTGDAGRERRRQVPDAAAFHARPAEPDRRGRRSG